MNIDEIKNLADTIVGKREKKEKLTKYKDVVDERTDNGNILIQIPAPDKHSLMAFFEVDAIGLKKLIDDQITNQDSVAEEEELKKKIK